VLPPIKEQRISPRYVDATGNQCPRFLSNNTICIDITTTEKKKKSLICVCSFLTVEPHYRRQDVTDALDFQMQVAKPARSAFQCLSTLLPLLPRPFLPVHLVWLVTLSKAERTPKVACEQVNLLDVGQKSLVDSFLVSCSAAVDLLLLYSN
jgi:hypothetical protein